MYHAHGYGLHGEMGCAEAVRLTQLGVTIIDKSVVMRIMGLVYSLAVRLMQSSVFNILFPKLCIYATKIEQAYV